MLSFKSIFELLIQSCAAKDRHELLACHSYTLGLWHSSLTETLGCISDTTTEEKKALQTSVIYKYKLKTPES